MFVVVIHKSEVSKKKHMFYWVAKKRERRTNSTKIS